MVIVTCAPCLASTVAPVAAGTLAALGLRENKKGGSGYETQEEYEEWKENGEDLDCFTQEETSTTIVHPDGSETGDYSDSPQNW